MDTSFIRIFLSKKGRLVLHKPSHTRKRYSTLYSTPSLAEVKHTRSSYSYRDDRFRYGKTVSIYIYYEEKMQEFF